MEWVLKNEVGGTKAGGGLCERDEISGIKISNT